MKINKLTYKILPLAFLLSAQCFISTTQAENVIAKLDKVAVKNNNHNQINLLFFQKSNSAEIIPNKTNKNCYQLVLKDTNHKILYFSNEPARLAGSITLPQFLVTWKHNFMQYKIEPNVVVNGFINTNGKKTKEMTDIAFFSHPVYDAQTKQLSYSACSISQEKNFSDIHLTDLNLFFDPLNRWPA